MGCVPVIGRQLLDVTGLRVRESLGGARPQPPAAAAASAAAASTCTTPAAICSPTHPQPTPLHHEQEEEGKYAKVIKIGDKLYGVPAVEPGTFGLDLQQQTGRRWEELVYELNGEALFNRDPVYALPDQGTKSNPVLVRCVSCMDGVLGVGVGVVGLCLDVDGLVVGWGGHPPTRRGVAARFCCFMVYTEAAHCCYRSLLPDAWDHANDNPDPPPVLPRISQVPSGENERVVGFEDPACHQVFWFKLRAGDLAYVNKIDKYFKLHKIC